MTASVCIINTSNWDGEDIRVTHNGHDTVLKPTEKMTFSVRQGQTNTLLYDMDIREKPTPHYEDDKQCLPKVECEWKPF